MGGIIEAFKLIHGIDKANIGKLFCIDEEGRTRNHSLCLKIRRNGLNFFTRRVVNYWNHLTDEVVSCKSLTTFKIKLNGFMSAKEEI